ncbi:unnamed protein product [Prorocentrum cordatum]|uniref:Uncharacterized protein n=1 Tax=Prorocentrum cordatum TaxID=2364126 RepID=A0ABN9UBG2_9DINO|nr:unnamed protein product [Polarella glacialis]
MVPTSPAGRVVAGLMCVCGVMIMAVASAQFSLLFRERWVQAKARDHFRRQLESHSDGALARERDEIEQLAANMRHTVDQLVAKVAGASLEAGDGSTPAEVAPLLMSIKEHAAVLNVGTCSFIYDALASALLESEAKSAIAEVPPDAEGRAEFSTPARQPSMSDVGSAATTAAIVRQLSPAAGYPGSQLGLLRKRATSMALTAQEMCLDEDAPHPAQMERRCSDPGIGRHRSANVLGEDTAAGAEGAGAEGPTPTGLEPEPLARASEGFSDVSDVSDENDGKADGRAAGAVLERPSVAPARPAGAGDEDDIEASDGEARGCAAGAVPERPALALARPAEAGDKNDDVEADDGEGDGRADVEAEGEDEGEHDKGSHGEARDENAAAARPARAASEDAPDEGPQ